MLAARVWRIATPPDTATLNTLAQVAGGIFGTIVTVVVFAVSLSAQRPDGGWAFMPFVARRHHVFFAAALSGAVALADAVMPALADWAAPGAIRYLLLFNIGAVPAIGLLTLLLMCRVIESASGSDVESTLPVFRAAMARIADSEKRGTALANQFGQELSAIGLKFGPWAGRLEAQLEQGHLFLGKGFDGYVVDVDFVALRELGRLCAPYASVLEISLLTAPGFAGDKRGIAFVRIIPGNHPAIAPDAEPGATAAPALEQLLDPDIASRLSRILDRLFITGPKPRVALDTRQFFRRLGSDLMRLAEEGDALGFQTRLEEFTKFLAAWLDVAPIGTAPPRPTMFSIGEPAYAGPLEIDFFDLLRAATRSEDAETHKAVVYGVCKIMVLAEQRKQASLYREATRMFSFSLWCAVNNEKLRDPAREMFDRRMHSMAWPFKCLRFRLDQPSRAEAEQLYAEESQFVDAFMGSAVAMIRYAVQAKDKECASLLLKRMSEPLENAPHSPADGSPKAERGETLVLYSIGLVFSWLFHLIQKDHASRTTAAEILLECIPLLPPRHELVALWELYHGNSVREAEIDDRLDVTNWTIDDENRRVGVTYTSGGDAWIGEGFQAAMLVARDPLEYELEGFFPVPPPRFLWDVQGLQERLTTLAPAIPGLSESQAPVAVAAVVSLIGKRHRVAEATALRLVAEQPLSPEREQLFRDELERGLNEQRVWPKMLQILGGTIRAAVTVLPPLRIRYPLPRDYFLPINNWGGGYGHTIGERVASREAMALVNSLERALTVAEPVTLLAELANAIRAARRVLVERGHSPSLLIVPRQDRVVSAFLECAPWQTVKRREWSRISLGSWEELNVVRCPYSNTNSVILAGAAAAFGSLTDGSQSPVVDFRDVEEVAKSEFLARITDNEGAALPESSELQVEAAVTAFCPVGLGDLSAAVRLDLQQSDGCYKLIPGDGLYHRPSCSLVQGAANAVASLFEHIEGEATQRTECPICHPEQWDLQAAQAATRRGAS